MKLLTSQGFDLVDASPPDKALFHFQHPDVRDSSKTTTDDHDGGTQVDTVEHWNDSVAINARMGAAKFGGGIVSKSKDKGPGSIIHFEPELVTPEGCELLCGGFVYRDADGRQRIVMPREGVDMPLVMGGAVTISGLFATSMANSMTNTAPIFNLVSTHQRVAMFTNSITPNFDDATVANLAYSAGQYASNEVSGTGYSTGGAGDSSASGTIGTPSFTNASGTITYTQSASAVWTGSTITAARCALIYDNGMSPKYATSLITFGSDYGTSTSTFTIQWSGSGIWTWNVHA